MNNEMISFPRELSADLAELIAEKARVCGGGAYDIWEAICEGFGKPAAQPQGEPVTVPVMPEMVDRRPYDDEEPSGYLEGDDDWSGSNPGAVEWLADNHAAIRAALYTRPAEQPAPVAVAMDEREEFVAWVRQDWPQAPLSNVRDLLPKDDPRYGEYCDEALQRAWVGWQARSALFGKSR